MTDYYNLLLYGGLIATALFYILFSRNIKKLTTDELNEYKQSSSRRSFYTTIALFGALYYFQSFNIRLLLGCFIILNMMYEDWLQKQKLKRLNFNPDFMKSMGRAGALAYVGVIMITTELIIEVKCAT